MEKPTWKRMAGAAVATAVASLTGVGCYIDNPNAAKPTGTDSGAYADAAGDGATVGDGGEPDADRGPPLCTKYGGYATMEKVVADLFGALVADCRVSRFFTGLTPERQAHLYDCLVKQVAVVMRCPDIRYDVDNAGAECRDMKTSHKGLSIRGADFDALVQDLVVVLQKDGVAQADIDSIAPSLLGLRGDIVTNSAPGNARVCDAGGGG